MRRKIATATAAAALALTGLAAAPSAPGGPVPSPLAAVASAEAAVTKSLSGAEGGGGNIAGAGNRLGDLLSGWGVPVLISLAGVLLVGSLTARNIGTSVGIVVITLVGLIFLLSPSSIETAAKGIASTVF
jgi:hypothetical protein